MLLSAFLLGNPAFAASYTVAPNDTLHTIGTVFNTSAETVMKDNGLQSSMVFPGQVLYVRAETYTVKSGDTMYAIARKSGISLYTLRKANNKWDNMLYPGQALAIPTLPASGAAAGVSYSQSDLDLLARLITAEADGEPYNAKVGVGAVVVNRVKSSDFPDSISSVIYQKCDGYYQFTPVENGWIDKPASADSKKAAYAALNGNDPVGEALFYFDDSCTSSWMWSKPLTARIGHMVYVY